MVVVVVVAVVAIAAAASVASAAVVVVVEVISKVWVRSCVRVGCNFAGNAGYQFEITDSASPMCQSDNLFWAPIH